MTGFPLIYVNVLVSVLEGRLGLPPGLPLQVPLFHILESWQMLDLALGHCYFKGCQGAKCCQFMVL